MATVARNAREQLSTVTQHAGEKTDEGCILRCGQIQLWTGPLEVLFQPRLGTLAHVVTVNAEIFTLAHNDEQLRRILGRSLNTIDGRVVQGICKLLYPGCKIVRHSGSNFIFNLAGFCVSHRERLFLLGSGGKANAWAVNRLRVEFPGLEVLGLSPPVQDYPFDQDWNEDILKQIEQCRPHHLVVCFGPRKQEYWIHENSGRLTELGVRSAYGLGGTIDFLAGVKPRAPKWIQWVGSSGFSGWLASQADLAGR